MDKTTLRFGWIEQAGKFVLDIDDRRIYFQPASIRDLVNALQAQLDKLDAEIQEEGLVLEEFVDKWERLMAGPDAVRMDEEDA